MNECKHSMKKLGWRKGTQCIKCNLYLPRGLTWFSAPEPKIENIPTHTYWKAIGAALELGGIQKQAKIIDLISQKHNATEGDKIHNESGNCTACELIALIKGENK